MIGLAGDFPRAVVHVSIVWDSVDQLCEYMEAGWNFLSALLVSHSFNIVTDSLCKVRLTSISLIILLLFVDKRFPFRVFDFLYVYFW